MKWLIALCSVLVLTACIQEGGGPQKEHQPVIKNDDFMRPVSDLPINDENTRRSSTHVALGQAYMDAGKYGVALDESKIAVAYAPSYAPAHLLLAQTYALLEQYSSAEYSFKQAIQLAPGDPEVNNAYGWFLCSQKREKEGLPLLASAARNPYYHTPTRALTNAGLCYISLGEYDAAERELTRAYQTDTSNQVALYRLAEVDYKMKNYDGARQWLSMLLKQLDKPGPDVLWLGLRIERAKGSRSGQEGYAVMLRKEFPTSPEYKAFLEGNFQ